MKDRITIHILTKDRHSELALLLDSLRYQTYQNFDILIVDDCSGTQIQNCYFILGLINRLKLEGHKIKLVRNDFSQGCCYGRNKCIEEDTFDNPLTLRLDDDVILEKDYIEKLVETIDSGYDMATGIVPNLSYPEVKREVRFVGDIMNEHKLDNDGILIMNKDECGFDYIEDKIIPTHQFRTNCLYKSEINKKVRYPINLSTVAFREEGFFSFSAIIDGYKLAVRTGAKCFHLQCPSGGNRRNDYSECVKIDEETWRKWIKNKFKQHGNFLEKYNKQWEVQN